MLFLDRTIRPPEPLTINESSWQAKGLVAWYPLVQAGGNKLRDLSGRKFDGTFNATNFPKWRAAEGQAVLSFGESATDEIALPQILSTFTEATLWLWLRNQFNDGSGSPAHMPNFGNPNASHYPFSNSDTAFYSSVFASSRAGPLSFSGRALDVNHWHAMCVRTFPGAGNWQWWIRQEKIGSQTGDASVTVNSADWVIGRSSQAWKGQIAEVRVYNRALSETEICALAIPNARFELYQPLNPVSWPRSMATAGSGGTGMRSQIIVCG